MAKVIKRGGKIPAPAPQPAKKAPQKRSGKVIDREVYNAQQRAQQIILKGENEKQHRKRQTKTINGNKNENEREVYVKVLPKKLDEEVASLMVQGFGGTITKLTEEQEGYISTSKEGPFKSESYNY